MVLDPEAALKRASQHTPSAPYSTYPASNASVSLSWNKKKITIAIVTVSN